jgi:hypothetical protein
MKQQPLRTDLYAREVAGHYCLMTLMTTAYDDELWVIGENQWREEV